ncbi:hypothetical protein [Escherichia sp. MOD1-EC6163]|uniref:hypothetical protein n=1 Tax=Escherichia sp. MOD1-EC6163 TaxID=2093896 RepID=UPI000CF75AD6|nr:hypothetical protein [Escherichia sp. MOD1-EC6163]
MRYYKLIITKPDTQQPPVDKNNNKIGPFDSSKTPGCALHIEFDVTVVGYDVTTSGTMLALYGLPMSMLTQAVNLKGCLVSLYAGFTDGLPLANKSQQGEIINGEVLAAYGNWIGTNQSLNLIINPTPTRTIDGKMISICGYGKKGETLGNVLTRVLCDAFPDKKIECTISDNLILSEDEPIVYKNITSLAAAIRSWSLNIIRDERYTGVRITVQSGTIRIFDNTKSSSPKKIEAWELLGQPTWSAPLEMTFKCPLRGDICCGDIVSLPERMFSGTSSILMSAITQSSALTNSLVTFSGLFQITSVRHIGSFLTADGDAWVTVFTAAAIINTDAFN